jgi:recombination protein RecA
MYGKGISREGSLIDVGTELNIVKKSGAWYTYEGEQLGQGRENAKVFLSEHPELMVEISERILTEVGIGAEGDQSESKVIDLPAEDEADDAAINTFSAADEEPITLK